MSIAAGFRGLFKAALSRPHISGLIGSGLVLAAVTGLLSAGSASAETVNAGGTCLPNMAYTAPATISLASAANGLTVSDTGVTTYGVGGSSVAMVRGALGRCAPGFAGADRSGEYLAYTSYAVSWSYAATPVDTTTCRLTDVKVGLALGQLLPRLVMQTGTPSAVTIKWASFISGLQTHEDGHKALDVMQARSLLTDLQNLRAPCATIAERADSLTVIHLSSFVKANADHDHMTDYGRDQGAVW